MKKFLALMLSLAMTITFMPMSIFATDEQQPDAEESVVQEATEQSAETLQTGDEEEPIKEGEKGEEIVENSITFNVGEGGSYRLYDGEKYISYDYETEKFINNESGYIDEEGNPRFQLADAASIEIQVKPDDNYWLDRVYIGYDEYNLHPSKGMKSFKNLPGWEEKTFTEGDIETWYTFDINFDEIGSDNVYIETLFSTRDASYYDDFPEYANNRYQVVYDNLHGDDYYVEVNRNNAGWNKVESEGYYQYAKGDKLRFRICTPPLDEEAAKDKRNYPAIEISENIQDEEGNDFFIYSDEENEEIEVSGNTFGYEPQSNNGVKIKVWWSVYAHDYEYAWAEEDMTPYYLVHTDVIQGAGLVGFDDKYYNSGDLAMVDSKGKLRVETNKTATIKIEPDGGNEVDYVLLNGEKISGKRTDLEKRGFDYYYCEGQGTNSYTYTATDETKLYVAFRERTDWEIQKDSLNDAKFAYYVSGSNQEDSIKELLTKELYKKYLSSVFDSEDELSKCLEINEKEDGGIADAGTFHYKLEYDGETVEGNVDALENAKDIIVETEEDAKIVSLSSWENEEYYSVEIPFSMNDNHAVDGVRVYGNGVDVDYEYEVEEDRIGYKVTNGGNINNTLTIYNSKFDGNDYDKFPCNDGRKQQISYVIHNAKTAFDDKPGDEITLQGVSKDDPVNFFDNSGNVHGSGAVQSYKANVTANNDVVFNVSLAGGSSIGAVYAGTENLTNTSVSGNKITIPADKLDDTINIYVKQDSDVNTGYALVKYKNYGANNTIVALNENTVANPGGDGTKSQEFTSIGKYIKDNGKVKLTVGIGFPSVFTAIYINGVDYSDQIPKTRKQKVDNFYGQRNNVTITVEEAPTYDITTFTRAGMKDGNNDELFIGNFGWTKTDDSEEYTRDDLINGGNIELVKAVYKEAGKADEVYYDEENGIDLRDPDSAVKWNDLWDDMTPEQQAKIDDREHYHGGEAVFPAGTEVTIRLTPDYGKQLVGFGVNGKRFEKGDANEKNEYTFVVQSGNSHLYATFEDVENTVTTVGDNTEITNTSVSFTKGTEPVDAGTLNMKVDENATPAEGAENVVAALDINMDNEFYAGKRKANKEWTEEKSELDAEASITMTIKDIDAGDEVRVIREHEDNEEELDASDAYVDSNGNLVIKSDKFSTYTVCKDSEAKGKLGLVTLSSTDITYTGGVIRPGVKTVQNNHGRVLDSEYYTVSYSSAVNVGTYTVTVVGKGRYAGSKAYATFRINPKGATIKNPSKAKKAFTVKWKKQTAKMKKARIAGYQIQYGTSKSFAGAKLKNVKGYKKTSKKIKGKAKTTYYVRVRTYMKAGGKTLYSGWSATKSVKTK